jgi:hypothetical protein
MSGPEESAPRSDRRITALKSVGVVAFLGYGLLLLRFFDPWYQAVAENHPHLAILLLLLVAGLGYLAVRHTGGYIPLRDGHKTRYWMAPVAGLLVVGIWATTTGIRSRHGGYVHNYCAYGASSDAQLQGCLDHVNHFKIDDLDTNAARFAKGGLRKCLDDSGPYCPPELQNIGLQDQQDNTPGERP